MINEERERERVSMKLTTTRRRLSRTLLGVPGREISHTLILHQVPLFLINLIRVPH